MKMTLSHPCDNCPFLKNGGIRLAPERARQIARYFTDSQGATFPCHKTARGEHGDEDESYRATGREQICAGGLAYAEKQGKANQYARVMERIGQYDARKVTGRDLVFKSETQMVEANRTAWTTRRSRRSKTTTAS